MPTPNSGGGNDPDATVMWDAIHNLNSIYLGGGINTFKDNAAAGDFTNADFGANLGFFQTIIKKG